MSRRKTYNLRYRRTHENFLEGPSHLTIIFNSGENIILFTIRVGRESYQRLRENSLERLEIKSLLPEVNPR